MYILAAVLGTAPSLFWITVGIILSLVLPLAIKTLIGAKPKLEANQTFWQRWEVAKYLKVLGAALLVALVLEFLIGKDLATPKDAIIFGFAWEGLVNKFSSSAA